MGAGEKPGEEIHGGSSREDESVKRQGYAE